MTSRAIYLTKKSGQKPPPLGPDSHIFPEKLSLQPIIKVLKKHSELQCWIVFLQYILARVQCQFYNTNKFSMPILLKKKIIPRNLRPQKTLVCVGRGSVRSTTIPVIVKLMIVSHVRSGKAKTYKRKPLLTCKFSASRIRTATWAPRKKIEGGGVGNRFWLG